MTLAIIETKNRTYYTGMSAIGPVFGGSRDQAKPFKDTAEALVETGQRGFAMVLWEIVDHPTRRIDTERTVKYIRESARFWAPEVRAQRLYDLVSPFCLEEQDAMLEALSQLPEDERVACGYSLLQRRTPEPAPRGFAALSPERRRAIASMGGRAAHAKGRGHQFSTDEARAAGVKGGAIISANREHMAEIGRRGGNTVVERLGTEHLQEIGRRGGVASSRDRQRMAEIGRKGGRAKGAS